MTRIAPHPPRSTSRLRFLRRYFALALALSLTTSPSFAQSSDAPKSPPHPTSAMGPAGPRPVVVEYFTAVGCEQCVAAHRVVKALSQRGGVLLLAWHVDYWDYLGRVDPFARPQSAQRQQAYARAAGKSVLVTPQFVIDGKALPDHWTPAALDQTIVDRRGVPNPLDVMVRRDDGVQHLTVAPRGKMPEDLSLLLVSFQSAQMPAQTGLARDFVNVVQGNIELTTWDGTAPLLLRIPEREDPNSPARALLVQERVQGRLPGRIVGAVLLD